MQISSRVYRLADLPEITNPDLVTVATRIPDSVVSLISAPAFHEVTTEVPHEVHVALTRGSKAPRLDYPPLRVFTFSNDSFFRRRSDPQSRRHTGAYLRSGEDGLQTALSSPQDWPRCCTGSAKAVSRGKGIPTKEACQLCAAMPC